MFQVLEKEEDEPTVHVGMKEEQKERRWSCLGRIPEWPIRWWAIKSPEDHGAQE